MCIRRQSARGFTLTELLAALILVGILAALATPIFIRMIRDGRVNRVALHVAEIYRIGRARALGKGTPVLVRWEQTNWMDPNKSVLEIREAILPLVATPAWGCQNADWSENSTNSRRVMIFDASLENNEPDRIDLRFFDSQNNVMASVDLCFTPRGRAFIRSGPNGAFLPLTSVPNIGIENKQTHFLRKVFLPPNGVARLEL